ncbi:hypothetical protein [Aliiglaciecola sp. LCG003]|uniref:hypothetical protein n=1 Tax=Aliiglaciecola sp. LCG003 TaxID=3053655 RepID=UPI002572561E|nr:hypothetical protein [Aliiglaciecola sp. LCG003]WJG08087.1 hypothetical protein QR722_12100 [Aliiglaciecola sp. LCG003]
MTISQHAQKRCQQRGISPDLVVLLNALGMETQQKGNTYVLELDKHTQKTLTKKLKRLLMQIQRNVFVVISDDDHVITIAHKH